MKTDHNNQPATIEKSYFPVVSIGMPVYNGGSLLCKALDTLLAQLFRNFEIIISDNASSDNTEKICREYEKNDSRIRYYRQNINQGVGPNFLFVLKQAKGTYFMWAAHDDTWEPSFIASTLHALTKNPGAVCAVPKILLTDGILSNATYPITDKNPGERLKKYLKDPSDNSRFYGLYRIACARKSSHYITNTYASDWLFFASIIMQGKVIEVVDVLMTRRSKESTSIVSSHSSKNIIYNLFPLMQFTLHILRTYKESRNIKTLFHLLKLNLSHHTTLVSYRSEFIFETYRVIYHLMYRVINFIKKLFQIK